MGREIKRVPLNFNWPKDVIWGGYRNPFEKQSAKCPYCDGTGSTEIVRTLQDKWYGTLPFKPEDRGSHPWLPTDPAIRKHANRSIEFSSYCASDKAAAVQRESERLCTLFNGKWCHHLNADDVAALVNGGRLHDFTHEWTRENGWQPKNPPVIPTPQEVNEWSLNGIGHDSCNCWIVCQAEAERLGMETTCQRCSGEGGIWPTPEIKQQHEDWKPTEPPTGEGYQLWETVTEGSPISPVFATPEELADWLVNSPDYKWKNNDEGTTREQWIAFIAGPGWAPSMMVNDGRVMTGVQGMVENT